MKEIKLRADLNLVTSAHRALLDLSRRDAVTKQHARGHMTAREILAVLADDGSFVEYGGLTRSVFQGVEAPADGLIMGTARVEGKPVVLVIYDFSVFGGSQSYNNHHKISRIFEHAAKLRLPVISWLDGGGARPNDGAPGRRLAPETFVLFARLSGRVPTIGVVSFRAFAGHANLAGMCDCLIGVEGCAIGIGGPPLVQAAIGEKLTPEEIGPLEVHDASGVVDISVANDMQAVTTVKTYLRFFSESDKVYTAPDTLRLRDIVPENPRRAYDVRKVAELILDEDSFLEIRKGFGKAIVTGFGRIAGKTVGVVANQPMFQAGAIDAPAADKAARFVQICDSYNIPALLLCDTPGVLVGPEAEKTGIVRHSSRLLMALSNARVPLMSVVLRKAFGLGFYIMGSQALQPSILLAWPGAQYGGMGLEGAVAIMHQKELDDILDQAERELKREFYLEEMRHEGSALETAARFLYDDVIDPAETRNLLEKTMQTFANIDRTRPNMHYIEPI